MRYSSIDLLRMVAIMVMVVVHFTENLAGHSLVAVGFAAALFMFLTGVSYRLWSSNLVARGFSDSSISKISIRRGLFLFGLGFAFNILVWLPADTYNWDVLTLIGFSLFMLNLARFVPPFITLLFCISVLSIAPMAQSFADYHAYWTLGYFDPDLTLADVLQGFLVVGYFPIIPWMIYPLLGFVTGTYLFGEYRGENLPPSAPVRGLVVGGTLMGLAAAWVLLRNVWPSLFPPGLPSSWTMFPASVGHVVGTLGFAVFAFCGCHLWFDRYLAPERFGALRQCAGTFSRHSLSAYILHHVAHLWPLWIYSMLQGHEPTHLWQRATSPSLALALSALFLAGCYLLFRWMDKAEIHGIEAWMRWLCD